MTNESENSPITVAEIETAISQKQLSLCYQPKLDFELLNLKGFEALARWDHPTKGPTLPNEFIALAEEFGLIGRLTELVVDQAFRWFSTTPGARSHEISINFSAKRLTDLDFATWLYEVCRRFSIRPDSVTLDISESGLMEQRLQAFDMFTRLRQAGFKVAIDDYGIGPSSKVLLGGLPVSEIKIDKSYAMKASTSEEAKKFIQQTVEFGHSLDVKVSAGGVEDQETLNYLRKVKCDYAYGYLISRPMTGEQAAEWIKNRRQLTSKILF